MATCLLDCNRLYGIVEYFQIQISKVPRGEVDHVPTCESVHAGGELRPGGGEVEVLDVGVVSLLGGDQAQPGQHQPAPAQPLPHTGDWSQGWWPHYLSVTDLLISSFHQR